MANIILTGDRPTGKLHIGHYVGSLRNRVSIQNQGNYDEMYIMIADAQALTDNADNPKKIRNSIFEVMLDYLSVGLDPSKVTIFLQSEVSALTELTFYYANLVTVARLQRNPTVKNEIKLRNFEANIPVGFFTYPISQAADITAFKANIIPVGIDQLPMIEQTREIVRSFNRTYGDVLVECEAVLPESEASRRLPGTDGKEKMSKSVGNGIYLSDSAEVVREKVMSMYTDPTHVRIEDPGHIEGNTVFTYLDAFATDDHFAKYWPDFENLDQLKKAYQHGGIGDIKIKKFLYAVLEETLEPIRKKRNEFLKNPEYVYNVLKEGTLKAQQKANETLEEVRRAMQIDYFTNDSLLDLFQEQCGEK